MLIEDDNMKIPLFIKKIYYKLPLPDFIIVKISGRVFTKKFNDEVRRLKY